MIPLPPTFTGPLKYGPLVLPSRYHLAPLGSRDARVADLLGDLR